MALVFVEDGLLCSLFGVAAGHFETWLCFGVTPVGRSLPDYDTVTACRFRKMASSSTLAIRIAFVDVLVIGVPILTTDLVGRY